MWARLLVPILLAYLPSFTFASKHIHTTTTFEIAVTVVTTTANPSKDPSLTPSTAIVTNQVIVWISDNRTYTSTPIIGDVPTAGFGGTQTLSHTPSVTTTSAIGSLSSTLSRTNSSLPPTQTSGTNGTTITGDPNTISRKFNATAVAAGICSPVLVILLCLGGYFGWRSQKKNKSRDRHVSRIPSHIQRREMPDGPPSSIAQPQPYVFEKQATFPSASSTEINDQPAEMCAAPEIPPRSPFRPSRSSTPSRPYRPPSITPSLLEVMSSASSAPTSYLYGATSECSISPYESSSQCAGGARYSNMRAGSPPIRIPKGPQSGAEGRAQEVERPYDRTHNLYRETALERGLPFDQLTRGSLRTPKGSASTVDDVAIAPHPLNIMKATNSEPGHNGMYVPEDQFYETYPQQDFTPSPVIPPRIDSRRITPTQRGLRGHQLQRSGTNNIAGPSVYNQSTSIQSPELPQSGDGESVYESDEEIDEMKLRARSYTRDCLEGKRPFQGIEKGQIIDYSAIYSADGARPLSHGYSEPARLGRNLLADSGHEDQANYAYSEGGHGIRMVQVDRRGNIEDAYGTNER